MQFFVRRGFGAGWISLAVALAAASWSRAADAVAPAPVMSEPGKLLVDDSFAASLPKPWRGAMGRWEVADGAVQGTERAEQKHQAVLRRPLAFADAIISFAFRLDHARQISLSVNDAKEHVCRVVITPRGFVVQKDDHDHEGPDRPVVFARISMPIAAGEWHTATVEIAGAEMVAQIDGATHVGFGAHELLDRPKANFGFTAAGGPAEFRDVKVWAAKARADWPETKKKLAAK